jgi:hypothetical protein
MTAETAKTAKTAKTAETAWAHLPNAQHIDAVLADVRKRPEAWAAAWAAAWDAAWDSARGAVQAAVQAAVIALIAWGSSADLLECTPDVLSAMIDLAEPPVRHQAALLLPYAIVRFGTWP